MKQKNYYLTLGWTYALVSLGLLVGIVAHEGISPADPFGLIFGGCIVAFVVYKSYTSFKKLKTVSEETMYYSHYAPPPDATVQEQISFYKRILIGSALAFPVLSILIYLDLNSLETGAVDSVSIWAPVAILYEMAGYWVAVLATPVLGMMILGGLFRKISNLKYKEISNI